MLSASRTAYKQTCLSMPRFRLVQVFFLLFLIALAVSALAGLPLTWDGAFDLFKTLDAQSPYIPHNRLINAALELPVLASSHLTQNSTFLRMVFCLSYALVPAAGLAASWLICREKHPSIFVWPVLSCCLAMLPGQAGFCFEAIMCVWLMWPVFLAALIGLRRSHLPVAALMALAGFLAYPITAVLFALSAGVTVIAAFTSPTNRRQRLYGATVLGLMAVARMLVPLTEYEKQHLSIQVVLHAFRVAVLGLPLVALAFSLVGLACLLNSARNHSEARQVSKSDYVAIAAILAAGATLVPWALDPRQWAWELAYRFWAVPIATVFMIAAALEVLYVARSSDHESPSQNTRLVVLPFIGGVFLVVLSLQGLVWSRLTDSLERTLSAVPAGCIPRVALVWTTHTPLEHWGAAPYAIDIQGRKPKTLILDNCREFFSTGETRLSKRMLLPRHDVRLEDIPVLRRGGWFDLADIPETIISLRQLKPQEWAAP